MTKFETISPVPLVVDVDGTLIKTDLLYESALQHIAQRPFMSWILPLWLLGGKSRLKARLADNVALEVATIPLREETLALIRNAQADGRPVYLASASDERYVSALAERVGNVAGVFASRPGLNLAGVNKAAQLIEAFGNGNFDYVGDMPVDFPVWKASRNVFAVVRDSSFERSVMRAFPNATIVARPRSHARDYIKAMRPHQWAKNVLVFLPALAGHQIFSGALPSLLAFACFCAAASSAYIINDLLDLPSDREHPRKKDRPFASGRVPIASAIIMSGALMGIAICASLLLPPGFILVLLSYVGITLGYSLMLKRKLVVDVITLGGLYTIRVLGGVMAVGAAQSRWLLMFCLCLFLSLAVVKRCSELVLKKKEGKLNVAGRGYTVDDLPVITALAAASGYCAVLVFTMYLNSPEVVALYAHPGRMWLASPLLFYWISRVLLLSNRGELHDDPVVFALTDRVSWATGAAVAAVIALSI